MKLSLNVLMTPRLYSPQSGVWRFTQTHLNLQNMDTLAELTALRDMLREFKIVLSEEEVIYEEEAALS